MNGQIMKDIFISLIVLFVIVIGTLTLSSEAFRLLSTGEGTVVLLSGVICLLTLISIQLERLIRQNRKDT